MKTQFDAVVIGGGIVGLATARALQANGRISSILVIDKEQQLAQHQTGRNSGVIHAGIYYAPGSRKAILCRKGLQATKAFCQEHDIAFEERGKLIVATSELELDRLQNLANRAQQNGVAFDRLTDSELRREEPHIVGLGALLASESSIVNYREITEKLAQQVSAEGGTVLLGQEVTGIKESPSGVTVTTTDNQFHCAVAISCSGLWSDRLLRQSGHTPDFRIIPFRGSYFALKPRLNNLVHRMIYPVPDPSQPFLGVHITPMIGGFLTVGPNASVAFSREGYGWSDIDLPDAASMLGFPGFWHMLASNAKSAARELGLTLSKRAYLKAVQKYCPSITLDDFIPHPPGLRAQAVSQDGSLVDDFLFHKTDRVVHVCNAPSPAATSALPIGEEIASQVETLSI